MQGQRRISSKDYIEALKRGTLEELTSDAGNTPLEHEEQKMLFRYCSAEMWRYPMLILLTHVPNEGKRSAVTGKRMRDEGLRKGYPDLMLDYASCGYNGLRIELKRKRKYRITAEQKEWLLRLNEYGYASALCCGWEESWEFIKAYLDNDKSTVDRYINRTKNLCAK